VIVPLQIVTSTGSRNGFASHNCTGQHHFLILVLPWMGQTGIDFMTGIARTLAGAAIVAVSTIVALPALSQSTVTDAAKRRPAPGPIVGAGLPVLAVGYGVYWLVTRRRRKAE